MIIFSMRKSAGSALATSMAELLSVPRWDQASNSGRRITPKNSFGRRLHREILRFQEVDMPVMATHLHPTVSVINFVRRTRPKAVVLVRDPARSCEALKRHREIDNKERHENFSYRKYRDPKEVLDEFLQNWLFCLDQENLLFITFDQLIHDYASVLTRMERHYEIELPHKPKALPKHRFTGVGKRDEPLLHVSRSATLSMRFAPDFGYLDLLNPLSIKNFLGAEPALYEPYDCCNRCC